MALAWLPVVWSSAFRRQPVRNACTCVWPASQLHPGATTHCTCTLAADHTTTTIQQQHQPHALSHNHNNNHKQHGPSPPPSPHPHNTLTAQGDAKAGGSSNKADKSEEYVEALKKGGIDQKTALNVRRKEESSL